MCGEAQQARPAGQIPQAKPKPDQAKPSQTKEMGLDFLGFLRPIRGFSKGYEDSKEEKIPLPTSWSRLIRFLAARADVFSLPASLPACCSCSVFRRLRCNTGFEEHEEIAQVCGVNLNACRETGSPTRHQASFSRKAGIQ